MAEFLRWGATRINLESVVAYEYEFFIGQIAGTHRVTIHSLGSTTSTFKASETNEADEQRIFKLIEILDKHFECEQEGCTSRVQNAGI